jgi:hypothetical protein
MGVRQAAPGRGLAADVKRELRCLGGLEACMILALSGAFYLLSFTFRSSWLALA